MEMNGKYLGLDPSLTSFGITLLDSKGEMLSAYCVQTKLKGMVRLQYLLNHILNIYETNPDIIGAAMEGYSYASFNSSSSAVLHELGGLIKYHLWMLKKELLIVAPTSVKKFVLGKGQAEKNKMMLGIYKKWGKEFKNDDEADSFAIAKIAYHYHSKANGLAKHEKEVLELLHKNKEEL